MMSTQIHNSVRTRYVRHRTDSAAMRCFDKTGEGFATPKPSPPSWLAQHGNIRTLRLAGGPRRRFSGLRDRRARYVQNSPVPKLQLPKQTRVRSAELEPGVDELTYHCAVCAEE